MVPAVPSVVFSWRPLSWQRSKPPPPSSGLPPAAVAARRREKPRNATSMVTLVVKASAVLLLQGLLSAYAWDIAHPRIFTTKFQHYSRMFCACANYFRMAISTPQNQSQSIYFADPPSGGVLKHALHVNAKLKILYEPLPMQLWRVIF